MESGAEGIQGCSSLRRICEGVLIVATKILYENGDFWVCKEQFGTGNDGYAVYKNGITCSTRVARIGYRGREGFKKAVKICDKRAAQ